jgi:hypothetical protein
MVTFSAAVTAVLRAYIQVLRAYSPTATLFVTEQIKLLSTMSSTLPPLQTCSRSAAQGTGREPNPSSLSTELSSLSSEQSSAPSSPLSLVSLSRSLSPHPLPLNQPSPQSDSSSSCSDSSVIVPCRKSDMPSQSKFTSVEQDAPSKVPMLLPGDITPSVMQMYENTCNGYFDTKDVPEEKQVCRILAGLRDNRIQDWVGIHRDCLLTLMFPIFLTEFKLTYLPKDWEEITRIELLQLTQAKGSFCDFSVIIQARNSVLSSTRLHLNAVQLRHRIESGINTKLTLHCCLEKITSDGMLAEWLDNVSHVDDLLRSKEATFKSLAKKSHEATRHTNTFAEPSRRINTNPLSVNCCHTSKWFRVSAWIFL